MNVDTIATSERNNWLEMGRGLIVATEDALRDALVLAQKSSDENKGGSQTVFMDLNYASAREVTREHLSTTRRSGPREHGRRPGSSRRRACRPPSSL